MALFSCNRCGNCCTSLGRLIRIERRLSSREFSCVFALGRGRFTARLDPGATGLPSAPGTCLFLAPAQSDSEGCGTTCTIYQNRPEVCRQFKCVTLVITDPSGAVAGRVKGRRSFEGRDAALHEIWMREVTPIIDENDQQWAEKVKNVLTPHGYHAEPLV
ncbi:MAG: YkgJ family cysteine cluster protein [Methanomicrobiales archaeon]|nr:YkgJ family cysteine cluster protein [Methanomicrobiales archaeon]